MLKGSFKRLLASIQTVKGVGPATAKNLRARGIETLEDALFFLPVRYQDRRRVVPISELKPGQEAVVAGRIMAIKEQGRPGRRFVSMSVGDSSGKLSAIWFRFHSSAFNRLALGQEIILFGRVEAYKGRPALVHPEIIPAAKAQDHAGRFVPVYREIPGVSAKRFRQVVRAILEAEAARLESPLPGWLIQKAGLLDLKEAFYRVHFPLGEEDASLTGPPRRTLNFTELFIFQAALASSRQKRLEEKAEPLPAFSQARRELEARLPFPLTKAQAQVLDELAEDLAQPRPMRRLLQGDVGSGKTVLAQVAMLATALSGGQAALMAPTEILAEQHFSRLKPLADDLGLASGLLTGSRPEAERRECLAGLAEGRIRLAVGTQALIQAGVAFKRLDLAVIDEQQRFGVLQRAALGHKGLNPHLLVMTATPIPRSLAMTFWGHLDISVLAEKPAGRPRIVTRLLPYSRLQRAWQAVEAAVGQGLQAYVVLPAIEPGQGLASAEERYKQLRKTWPHLRLDLLHGRLDSSSQIEAMARFAVGQTQVLVATSLIEVGLDVPQAAVMVIENAERFGLAQLHQLRGRIGRGANKAACLLVSDATGEALARLKLLEETDDGFKIAEADLAARGPGEVLGARQAGWPDFRLANLLADSRLLVKARQAAEELIARDPLLAQPEHQLLAEMLSRHLLPRLGLSRAG